MNEKKPFLEDEIEAVEAQLKTAYGDLAKIPAEMQLKVTGSLTSLQNNIKKLREA